MKAFGISRFLEKITPYNYLFRYQNIKFTLHQLLFNQNNGLFFPLQKMLKKDSTWQAVKIL